MMLESEFHIYTESLLSLHTSVMTLFSRPISTLINTRLILLHPLHMSLTHMLRRNHPIKLPQPPLSLLNMILTVIPLLIDMALQRIINHTSRRAISLCVVVQTNGNVFDDDADEWFVRRGRLGDAADKDVGGLDCVEVDHDVKGGQVDAGVDFCYVGGEGGFAGFVFEDAGWVVDLPEGHRV